MEVGSSIGMVSLYLAGNDAGSTVEACGGFSGGGGWKRVVEGGGRNSEKGGG